jgi:hypothetical protein
MIAVPVLTHTQLAVDKICLMRTNSERSEPGRSLEGYKILLTITLFLFLLFHLLSLPLLLLLGSLALFGSHSLNFFCALLLD